MTPEEQKLKSKVKKVLAEYLGVDIDDLSDDDSLREDLHMGTVDINDFMESLKNQEVDTSTIDLSEIETIGDIIELLM